MKGALTADHFVQILKSSWTLTSISRRVASSRLLLAGVSAVLGVHAGSCRCSLSEPQVLPPALHSPVVCQGELDSHCAALAHGVLFCCAGAVAACRGPQPLLPSAPSRAAEPSAAPLLRPVFPSLTLCFPFDRKTNETLPTSTKSSPGSLWSWRPPTNSSSWTWTRTSLLDSPTPTRNLSLTCSRGADAALPAPAARNFSSPCKYRH